MTAAYQHLTLGEVQPGMVLSDEILDQHGKVLLPKGAVLSASTIALLPRHGIEMLAVLRNDSEGEPVMAAAPDPSAIELRLARLFRNNVVDDHDDWATGILRRYVEDFRLGREIEQ
ncbi:MAG: hypothetical protein V4508_09125 [Pseudomonadota bacterium]